MRASAAGRVPELTALLKEGADPNARAAKDRTALTFASAGGHTEAAQVLLDAGAKVDAKDEFGYTALIHAAGQGHAATVELLLARGAKPNRKASGRVTPLLEAASSGSADVVEALIRSGAKVNATRERRRTALMFAAASGVSEAVGALLRGGASVDAKSKSGWTPLMIARAYGHERVVKLLTGAGATDLGPIACSPSRYSGTSPGQPPSPLRLTDPANFPKLLRQRRPKYTQHALVRRVQGETQFEVVILKNGRIGPVRILKGLDAGLDLNGVEALCGWRFEPGQREGEPVAVVADIQVDFTMLK